MTSILEVRPYFQIQLTVTAAWSWNELVSLNRLSVGYGTTPRRQSGYLVGFCLFIRLIYTMLPPHGHWLIRP